MDNEIIYADDDVIVSRSVATIFGKSFQIRLVSSVDVKLKSKPFIAKLLFFLFGVLVLTFGIASNSEGHSFIGYISIAIGFVIIILSVNLGKNKKNKLDLIITAGSEVAAMSSEDPEYLAKIRLAIERAMQMQ
jgi:hypothetical protein